MKKLKSVAKFVGILLLAGSLVFLKMRQVVLPVLLLVVVFWIAFKLIQWMLTPNQPQ